MKSDKNIWLQRRQRRQQARERALSDEPEVRSSSPKHDHEPPSKFIPSTPPKTRYSPPLEDPISPPQRSYSPDTSKPQISHSDHRSGPNYESYSPTRHPVHKFGAAVGSPGGRFRHDLLDPSERERRTQIEAKRAEQKRILQEQMDEKKRRERERKEKERAEEEKAQKQYEKQLEKIRKREEEIARKEEEKKAARVSMQEALEIAQSAPSESSSSHPSVRRRQKRSLESEKKTYEAKQPSESSSRPSRWESMKQPAREEPIEREDRDFNRMNREIPPKSHPSRTRDSMPMDVSGQSSMNVSFLLHELTNMKTEMLSLKMDMNRRLEEKDREVERVKERFVQEQKELEKKWEAREKELLSKVEKKQREVEKFMKREQHRRHQRSGMRLLDEYDEEEDYESSLPTSAPSSNQ
ncbi:hypothetical protein ADUPG1_011872, partial [Aduncisulcus paluster]